MNEIGNRLRQGSEALGIHLTPEQTQKLLDLTALLARWSRAYNLTAVREPMRMVAYHLLDSLALLPFLHVGSILDLGTGAGFPGLPLAIMCPETDFVLLDGNGKKIRFVRQAVMELGLRNVGAVQARIESYPSRRKFVTICARAFAPLPDILALTEPLLQRPGVLLAPKSRGVAGELEGLDLPAGVLQLHRLQVPFVDGERVLVQIDFR